MTVRRPIVLLVEEFSKLTIQRLSEEGFEVKTSLDLLSGERDRVLAIFTKVSRVLSENFLNEFINLRYIVTPSTGTDTIKLSVEKRRHVKLITLRDDERTLNSFYSTREVFFWLLVSLLRHTYVGAKEVENGYWDRNLHLGENIQGKHLGIIGYGRVGKQIAAVALAMGMQVSAYDVEAKLTDGIEFGEVTLIRSIEKLVSSVNVISINVDDRLENRQFFGSELISEVSPSGVYVINTARGFVVDEEAIIAGLTKGQILGYAADVLTGEGASLDWLQRNRLWQEMNRGNSRIVLTPHLGGATRENILRAEFSVVATFCRIERSNS